MQIYGYAGRMLRVNLDEEKFYTESLDQRFISDFVGGAGFGAKYLYQEHPKRVEWSDPENKIIFANGPFSNTVVGGSGTTCVTAKGPMTNLAGSSQANGYMGAFLKSCEYDGLIINGKASRWSYLYIARDRIELKDASHLFGKDVMETQEQIKKELGGKNISVYCVGPAAEHGVRFSVIAGDGSHIVSKNGMGAILASKNLKAIAVSKGDFKTPVFNQDLLKKVSKELYAKGIEFLDGSRHKWGTAGTIGNLHKVGAMPVRNYTTNIFPEHEKMTGQYVRTHFEKIKRLPCHACGIQHNFLMKVTEGPYAGFMGEEPELEAMTGLGSQLGIADAGAVFVLFDLVDRLGMDCNETGWTIGWVMECFEKGLLTKKDTDGLDMVWGNVEAVKDLIHKIARREGIGNLLADGVKRASEAIGGEAVNMAVCTKKGTTPRGHDHRARWSEHLDTCFSNTSSLEATFASARPNALGLPPTYSQYSPWEVPAVNAIMNGWHIIEDSLGACRFNITDPQLVIEALNAVTNGNNSIPDLIKKGKRIVNILRVFNFKNGLTSDMEAPSTRYGSAPVDGPLKGISLSKNWDVIQEIYYRNMGWDPLTGMPTPETLRNLGLDDLIKDLYP